ncbi:MAG: acyl carrier protein [Clostridia bacterium]|nr:acyl carrier protein [Clostridia bacterium]
MEEKVYAIISEHFKKERVELSPKTDLASDLKADSLDLVELIMAFEDAFRIEISDETALSVKTIGDILECLKGSKE